jgi:hypothetical protein
MPARARPEEQEAILAAALERVSAAGARAVVVCDLDSTLLDNRPRLARILQDFGRLAGLPELTDARPAYWPAWSVQRALEDAGLSPALAAEYAPAARRFFADWFFTSAYCRLDVPVPGAPAYARALAATGAVLAYVSGRPQGVEDGTREVFHRHGFPMPDGRAVHLLLKPERQQSDDTWKLQAVSLVERLGPVVAAFDNEPLHINGYARAWPEAMAVHVDTEDSARPVEVLAGIRSIRDFTRG